MRIFIDSANIEEIRSASEMGIISGVTTNPSLVAKEGKDFVEVVTEICSLVDGSISAEVLSLKKEEMLVEARKLSRIHPNIVIKIPMTAEGLKVVKLLKDEGIRTNVTLVFSANQALLAARAGAAFVSPFVGRIDDISNDGMDVVSDIVQIFARHGLGCEVIAASIRHPQHVKTAALLGSDIATVPYKVLLQMLDHPLTDKGIDKFLEDWNKKFK